MSGSQTQTILTDADEGARMTWKQGQVESISGMMKPASAWDEDVAKAIAESNAPFQCKPAPHPSGIIPTEFKVLLLPDTVEERTAGGIIKPAERVERDQYAAMDGVIIAASPLAFTYENRPQGARKPQVGDRVIFAKYSGAKVTGKDGVDYRLVTDKDVMAVLE